MSYDAITKQFTGEPATAHRCWNCGLNYAVPKSLSDAWSDRRKHSLTCPACGESAVPADKNEKQKLQDELVRAKQRTEQAEADARWQRKRKEAAYRQTAAAKGRITKMKNRIKNGVCPVCNRTFVELGRHMHSQHPAFAEPEK